MTGVAAIAAVVIAAVVVVITIGLGGPAGSPKGHATPQPSLSAGPAANPAPAQGAYFGAWVRPLLYNQAGYVGAVDTLQQQIGRRLDIVHVYLKQDATVRTHRQIKALVYFDSNTTGTSPQTSFALDAGPLAVFRGIADS